MTCVDADTESSQDEEERQTVEHGIVGSGKNLPWVFGFSRRHGDIIGTGNGEGCLDQALQKPEETTEVTLAIERIERPWVVPVAEAVSVFERVATQHGNEGENDQADDEQDLPESGPKLGFTIPLDRKHVDQAEYSCQ